MVSTKTVCTACSCLCDDVGLQIEDDIIRRVENACRKGSSFLYGTQFEKRRNGFLVEGRPATLDEAIDRASRELSRAKRPFIFGLDNSSLSAQALGIELARRLRGSIDDTSSFCQGAVVDHIIKGHLPSCTLGEVNKADLLLYWGANPHHSHPRHLSKFTIYAHPQYQELGATRQVTLAAVEVRESETSVVCNQVFRILPRGDRQFIGDVTRGMLGEPSTPDAQKLVQLFRRSKSCMVFVGLGLTYSLDADFSSFVEMIRLLSQWSSVGVIPMVGHFNMRGFNQSLYNATGSVNKVSFVDGVSHDARFALLEQVKSKSCDCIMVVGADPFSSLPRSVAQGLSGVPMIAIDPFESATTRAAAVTIGTAVTGMEVKGTAVRMDGTEVELEPGLGTSRPSDEEVLQRILGRIGG